MLFFDGSARNKKAGAGVVLIDPNGEQVMYIVLLDFEATNNMVEYEALIFGLTAALSLGSSSSWSRETPSSSSSRSGGTAVATNPSSHHTSSM
jgi:ribonuclease HI